MRLKHTIIVMAICIVAALAVLVVSLTQNDLSDKATEKEENNRGIIQGTFAYKDEEMRRCSVEYYYSDAYFKESGYDYNSGLATMSLCLERSIWAEKEEDEEKDVEKVLEKIGFSGIEIKDTEDKTTSTDSIGVVAANRMIRVDGADYMLIALVIGEKDNQSEWAGNMTFGIGENDGDTGIHQGLHVLREQVIRYGNDYMKKYAKDKRVKLWITGYSRGGAAAGLAGAWYDDNGASLSPYGITLFRDNIFTYTFEAPQGTTTESAKNSDGSSKELYNNIHNIVNPNDGAVKIGMTEWGFARVGEDLWIPSRETDGDYEKKEGKMIKILNMMNGMGEYEVDHFETKIMGDSFQWRDLSFAGDFYNQIPQSIFLDHIIKTFTERYAQTRTRYVHELQESFRYLGGLSAGADTETPEEKGKVLEALLDSKRQELVNMVLSNSEGEETAESIVDVLIEGGSEAGITYEDRESLKQAIQGMIPWLEILFKESPDDGATLTANRNSIKAAHRPEICLAWLMSMDGNYTDIMDIGQFTAAGWRRMVIQVTNVNLENPYQGTINVYGSQGELIESYRNRQKEKDSSLVIYPASESSYILYLPLHEEYMVELTGEKGYGISVSVEEYSYDKAETVRVTDLGQYYVMEQGLKLNCPALSRQCVHIAEGSTITYSSDK